MYSRAVHLGVGCDVALSDKGCTVCGWNCIVGDRYKKKGSKYNLCSAQFEKLDDTAKLDFIKISDPKPSLTNPWATPGYAYEVK